MTTIRFTEDEIQQHCTTYHPSGHSYDIGKDMYLHQAQEGGSLVGLTYQQLEDMCTRYESGAKITDLAALTILEEAWNRR